MKYTKPEANVNSFISENVVTTSGTGSDTPVVNPEALVKKGFSIGTVKNLFK